MTHKILLVCTLFALLVLPAGAALAKDSSSHAVFSSLRGGVYEDPDGDGRCDDAGRQPVAGVGLLFTSGAASLRLTTGSDGTYGLVDAGQGRWLILAQPNADWTVTSQNPLLVEVSAAAGLVRTGLDFCVRRLDGSRPAAVRPGPDAVLRAVVARVTSGLREAPPAKSDSSDEATALRGQISEALLTSPPERAPIEEVAREASAPAPPAPPAAEWLTYLNRFRQIGGLPLFEENAALSRGSQAHSRYMVVNDAPIAHAEETGNPLYDPAGHQAAQNGNIFATTEIEANHVWSTNFWISAPFHLVPILDPGLASVGFGRHNQAIGVFQMAAVLDVRSDLGQPDGSVAYPLYFPGSGAQTWVVRHSLYEWPNPLASCPGYARPAGAPLVLQLGDGSGTPRVTRHELKKGGQTVESCRFDETTYTNPTPYEQQTGRTILGDRDAVVIIPRQPLAVGETYQVTVEANGQTYSWEFSTIKGPP